MKNYFPQKDKEYLQSNRSNVLGNIWSSFNLDLQSNLGVIRIAPRLLINTSTADQVNLGVPCGFKFFGGRYFTIAGSRIFKNTGYLPSSNFSEDTSTGVQTNYNDTHNDLEFFGSALWATGNGSLYTKANSSTGTGAWSLASATSGGLSLMVVGRKFNRLYYTLNSSKVNSTNGTTYVTSGDYTLQLGFSSENSITSICETSSSIWLGTTNTDSQNAKGSVFQWDGISAQPSDRFYLNAPGAYALVTRNDVPYVMDSFGVLSAFTGSSFEEVGRLPFSDLLLNDNAGGFDDENTHFIHPKGMIVTKNNTILCLVANNYDDPTNSISENCPSGIYEWSEDKGFVHKHSLSYSRSGSSTITDFGQNQIATNAGDVMVGGLSQAWTPSSSASRNGMIICGASYFTDATTFTNAIFINDSKDTIQKKGYFVTNWLESEEVADAWDSISASFKTLDTSGDNIVFKYRTTEVPPVYGTITWVDTTTFTVANSAVDVSQYWTSDTGGEVEITQGTGGGTCSHITNAVNNAGTWTVTLDEVITGVTTGTAKARFQKWIKLYPKEELTTLSNYLQSEIGTDSTPRIQIKCCMTWMGDGEFYKAIITSNEDVKS